MHLLENSKGTEGIHSECPSLLPRSQHYQFVSFESMCVQQQTQPNACSFPFFTASCSTLDIPYVASALSLDSCRAPLHIHYCLSIQAPAVSLGSFSVKNWETSYVAHFTQGETQLLDKYLKNCWIKVWEICHFDVSCNTDFPFMFTSNAHKCLGPCSEGVEVTGEHSSYVQCSSWERTMHILWDLSEISYPVHILCPHWSGCWSSSLVYRNS